MAWSKQKKWNPCQALKIVCEAETFHLVALEIALHGLKEWSDLRTSVNRVISKRTVSVGIESFFPSVETLCRILTLACRGAKQARIRKGDELASNTIIIIAYFVGGCCCLNGKYIGYGCCLPRNHFAHYLWIVCFHLLKIHPHPHRRPWAEEYKSQNIYIQPARFWDFTI